MFHDGQWRLCDRAGWPDNQSCQNLVAWSWDKDDQRCLVVVNLSDVKAQARIHVPWNDAHGESWRLNDALTGATYDREGDELETLGLYVDLAPWNCHILHCYRSREHVVASAA